MLVHVSDGYALTILRAATLRWKLQITLSISPSHSMLTPGQPDSALTLELQAPGSYHWSAYRLIGLVVKASASRAEGPGFESSLRRDFFLGQVIPVTSKLALQWLPCQATGVIWSALGLVGPVSVYCDWVR